MHHIVYCCGIIIIFKENRFSVRPRCWPVCMSRTIIRVLLTGCASGIRRKELFLQFPCPRFVKIKNHHQQKMQYGRISQNSNSRTTRPVSVSVRGCAVLAQTGSNDVAQLQGILAHLPVNVSHMRN